METKNELNNLEKNDKTILLFLLFLPCLLIRRALDNDTWFLLNSGRYVMEHGLPFIEPFSIHENLDFVLQQWLTDVIFWNIYSRFGENGLFLLVAICYAVIIYLMYKLTMKVSGRNFFVSFVITFLTCILIFTYMVTRPTIFTLIIVMIELNILESYVLTGRNKYLLVLPILSLMMINLHAALWPMLFVMILPYIVSSFKFNIGFFKNEGFGKKYLLLTVVAMILIAFINPYGLDAITYLIKSVGYPNMKNISEIQHPYVMDFTGAIVYSYIFLIALVYILYRKGSTKVQYFLLTMGTIFMVLISIRNVTYFGICSMFPLAYYLKDFTIKKDESAKRNNKIRAVLIALIIIVLITGSYYNNIRNNTYTKYLDLNNTIDYIYKNEDISEVILYTGFNEGSLVQFRGIPSYIDPRAEVYFKRHNNGEDIFNEYFDLRDGNVYYKDILDKYGFTHLIVPKVESLSTYLQKDSNYAIVYENDKYYLFKRVN